MCAWDLWPRPGWVPGPWRRQARSRTLIGVPARHVALWLAIRLRTRDASGQTSAEYIGVLLVVAAIISALLLTDPGQAIGDKLSQIVRDIAGSGELACGAW